MDFRSVMWYFVPCESLICFYRYFTMVGSKSARYGMKISYDRLWKLLIDKKMKRTDLITQAQISSNVVAKMGKEEPISMESIGKICALFH